MTIHHVDGGCAPAPARPDLRLIRGGQDSPIHRAFEEMIDLLARRPRLRAWFREQLDREFDRADTPANDNGGRRC